jgi:hypothetical protein
LRFDRRDQTRSVHCQGGRRHDPTGSSPSPAWLPQSWLAQRTGSAQPGSSLGVRANSRSHLILKLPHVA